MNERIKELIKQSRDAVNAKYGLSDAYNNLVMEAIAELIVQECINVLNPEGEPTTMREEHARFLSMNMIKRHFGVE